MAVFATKQSGLDENQRLQLKLSHVWLNVVPPLCARNFQIWFPRQKAATVAQGADSLPWLAGQLCLSAKQSCKTDERNLDRRRCNDCLCSHTRMQICSIHRCVCSSIPVRNRRTVRPHSRHFNIMTARTSRETDSGDNEDISGQDSKFPLCLAPPYTSGT